MSQEKPPVRSRRELRQARDENTAPGSNRPGQISPASKQRRAADTPVDSVPEQTPAQRSSQIRARDRAALRAIKELEEKEGQLSAGGPPTRRQLRLQQLKEQAVTSANPIIPAPMGQPLPSQPAPSQPKPGQAKPGQAKPGQTQPDPSKPGHGTAVSAEKTGPSAPNKDSGVPAGMSVEQALAARALIAEQARNQLAKMEHIASLDPEAVDPDILAEQIALAERAAVLNRRAMAKQKLAEQAAPAQPVPAPTQAASTQATESVPRTGPATADNLAMVTPLEFVQVPGIDRPVMKPPATSYVPLMTQPGPKVRAGGKGRRPSTASTAPAAGSAQAAAAGRSSVIARAEAAARAATAPKSIVPVQPVMPDMPVGEPDDLFDDLPRIPARSAHGLEPLDAATAGLARAKRLRLMQVLVLAFGIVALICGVILIVSGISG
ncbi:hypothetical protein QK290_11760 [Pseudarthrobacter sp. AL07]|uniref:hypothetical protein n=1 Tax=unclassified Pseudarthrobacter TaxID=2647000 RepID=UPI00249B2243|nr:MULTISPECIES: hypothetical protein [unclassified Pseudarthrobacter]MDI3195102.1 hypothetical protein [Pseudarthrobacter sp. AL20]MDI3209168.1 hypothetical protein [Pseudarthrobacter sp. AL07]